MYINGRKITIDELQELADKLVGALINDVFDSIKKDGMDIACPGSKDKQKAILKKMMSHYVKIEEYEKCAYLRDLILINKLYKNGV
tara:strand:- start:171 stop:428 length:258 start_codon:yes stop_codon:yes gene_type:complete